MLYPIIERLRFLFNTGVVFFNYEPPQMPNMSTAIEPFVKHAKYKLRMASDKIPGTDQIKSPYWMPGPDADFLYNLQYLRGFLQIQDLIDDSLLDYVKDNLKVKELYDSGIYTQEQPYPCYERDM